MKGNKKDMENGIFFFQAKDGMRDIGVTGVQTCALPISRERNIENTALKTNLEAAEEAARQLRLRDLAGLIVIDFIDMDEPKNNRAVEKKLKDCMKDDRARLQMGKISGFGLMEISRQRRRTGVLEGTTHVCPHCHGLGRVRSVESSALAALRAIEIRSEERRVGKECRSRWSPYH